MPTNISIQNEYQFDHFVTPTISHLILAVLSSSYRKAVIALKEICAKCIITCNGYNGRIANHLAAFRDVAIS